MDTMEKYQRFVNTAMVARIERVVVERASGATYTDIQGKTYIECFSGLTVTNAGHCHSEVIEAAKAQMEKVEKLRKQIEDERKKDANPVLIPHQLPDGRTPKNP